MEYKELDLLKIVSTWRDRLNALNIKQYKAAKDLNVTVTSVNRWCNVDVSKYGYFPKLSNILRFEKYLRTKEKEALKASKNKV